MTLSPEQIERLPDMVLLTIGVIFAGFLLLAMRPRKPRVPLQCPFCSQPDRDRVFDGWENCRWVNPNPQNGSDPPCVCDGYGTKAQMRRLRRLGLGI